MTKSWPVVTMPMPKQDIDCQKGFGQGVFGPSKERTREESPKEKGNFPKIANHWSKGFSLLSAENVVKRVTGSLSALMPPDRFPMMVAVQVHEHQQRRCPTSTCPWIVCPWSS